MDPMTRVDGTEMMTSEESNATAGGALDGSNGIAGNTAQLPVTTPLTTTVPPGPSDGTPTDSIPANPRQPMFSQVNGQVVLNTYEAGSTAPPGTAPTTVPPTTVPPGTNPPTTVPPTTVPPTTVPATTAPPTTVPPTTVPPTTVPPGTVPPTTVPPTTVPPGTVPPGTVPLRSLDRKSDIIEDLRFWCDIEAHEDAKDTVQPERDPNALFMEVDNPDYYNTPEPEEKTITFLYYHEAVQLVEALAAASDKENLLNLVRRVLPLGVELTPRKLLATIHPDKFIHDNENTKRNAHQAFSRLSSKLEQQNSQRYQGIKQTDNTNVEILNSYHSEAYTEATSHLVKLYEAFQRGEEVSRQYGTASNLSDTVKAAHTSLQSINDKIQKLNIERNNPKTWGLIEVAALISGWVLTRDMNNEALLYEICENHHYPSGWRYRPPRAEYTYDYCREKNNVIAEFLPLLAQFYETLPKEKHYNEELLSKTADEILRLDSLFAETLAKENKRRNLPEKLHSIDLTKILPIYYGLKRFKEKKNEKCARSVESDLYTELARQKLPLTWSPLYKPAWEDFAETTSTMPNPSTDTTNSTSAQNAVTQTKVLGNGKVVLDIPVRSINRSFRPGYTTEGDQIIAIQRIGANSARYVVDTNGSRRIMSYGRAGGKLVLEFAKDANVPFTTTDAEALKQMVRESGGFTITYVAFSEWDPWKTTINGNPQIPFVIVGIGFTKGGQVHVSRSTLAKTIGDEAAQYEISRGMGGDEDDNIISTLMSKMNIEDYPHLVRWQNRRTPRLTYPGPMMNYESPLPPSSWQAMQAPHNSPPQQGFQQPQAPWASQPRARKDFQHSQAPWVSQPPPWQNFQYSQAPWVSPPQQGFQQPQAPWASQSRPWQGFQQPQAPWASQPPPLQGFQQPQAPSASQPLQEVGLFKDWSNLSKGLTQKNADLAQFEDSLKKTVPQIIQYLNETEEKIRHLNDEKFRQFHAYNSKDQHKKVLQGWCQDFQSVPTAYEVGFMLRELYVYAENLGHMADDLEI